MARSNKSSADTSTVVGYVRVSTDEQAVSGLGLAAQRAAIEAECSRRGWALLAIHEDALSGKNMVRPGLTAALAAVESGAASTIVVAKLDRLSRSLSDFASLMARAQTRRWNLVAVDLGIDLASASGEFMGNVLASAAQWERRIIGQRTKDALAVKRSQGVRLGRPQTVSADLVARIRSDHEAGAGWSALARQLNAEGVPTAHGGARWYPSTIRSLVLSAEAAA